MRHLRVIRNVLPRTPTASIVIHARRRRRIWRVHNRRALYALRHALLHLHHARIDDFPGRRPVAQKHHTRRQPAHPLPARRQARARHADDVPDALSRHTTDGIGVDIFLASARTAAGAVAAVRRSGERASRCANRACDERANSHRRSTAEREHHRSASHSDGSILVKKCSSRGTKLVFFARQTRPCRGRGVGTQWSMNTITWYANGCDWRSRAELKSREDVAERGFEEIGNRADVDG